MNQSQLCDMESPQASTSKPTRSPSKNEGESRQSEETEGQDNVVSTTPTFVGLYNVVKNIMEHLPLKDVLTAAQVCHQWADIGRIVRKQRKNLPSALLYHPFQPHHKEAFEYFNGLEVSEEIQDLVESGEFGYFGTSSKSRNKRQKFTNTGFTKAARSSFQKDFFKLYDEPQMLIGFGTNIFGEQLVKEYVEKSSLREKMKLIYGGIQSGIPCLTGLSGGLIAAIPQLKCAKSLEMEGSKLPGLACIGVPKTPSFTVKPFWISRPKCRTLRGVKGKDAVRKCQEILGITPEDENNVKGIVLLHKTFEQSSAIVHLMHEYLQSNPSVAFAGGLHEKVLISGQDDSSVLGAGMLILAEDDELVRVSTVALEDAGMTEKNMNKLNKLNESLLPDSKSFAFMFACNGRGREMHGNPNVESDLFNSLFPSTPLIGSFTWGEFCHEVLPNERKDGASPETIEFAYTTVFMVVSYKQLPDGTNEGN